MEMGAETSTWAFGEKGFSRVVNQTLSRELGHLLFFLFVVYTMAYSLCRG